MTRDELAQAICTFVGDPDLFFPDKDYDTPSEIEYKERIAPQLCAKCPVIEPCLELGMMKDNLRWGIFGGLTAKQRRQRATRES